MKKQVKQYMKRCKHFTGIQNDTCGANVNYRELVGGPDLGWARKIPCTNSFESEEKAICGLREYPTREEAEAHEAEVEQAINLFLDELKSGHCPYCHKVVAQQQVGSCVYGTCGHRLYQGQVNPKFAAGDHK